MEAKAKGQFYGSKFEAERVEAGLRKNEWYITEGGPDFSIYESKDGGKIKLSKIHNDVYGGYNFEIINAADPEGLASWMNEIGNVDIHYLIKLSGSKSRLNFAKRFQLSRSSLDNWVYGISKPPIHMIYMLETIIRHNLDDEK